MKRILSLVWALLSVTSFSAYPQSKAPAIVFDSQTKDFGTVVEGDPLKHVFHFTNKGSGTLNILNVAPS